MQMFSSLFFEESSTLRDFIVNIAMFLLNWIGELVIISTARILDFLFIDLTSASFVKLRRRDLAEGLCLP